MSSIFDENTSGIINKMDLLIAEIRLNKLDFIDFGEVYPSFFDNLLDVIYSADHEQIKTNTGIIFTPENTNFNNTHCIYDVCYKNTFDGEYSFKYIAVGGLETIKTIVFEVPPDDMFFLNFCNNKNALVVIKDSSTLRIFYNNFIYLLDGRIWSTYHPVQNSVLKMKDHYYNLNKIFYKSILEFSYYELSLNKIGGTIVYHLNEGEIDSTTTSNSESFSLNFKDKHQRNLLKNYMKYNDGAIVIDKNGIVVQSNVFLKTTDMSHKYVKPYSGTRHSSSSRYSFDNSSVIIFTISEDGPVSVFSEGFNIDTLSQSNGFKINYSHIHKIAEERGDISWEDQFDVSCSDCKKRYLVNIVTITGHRMRESVTCDFCGKEIYSKSCYDMQSKLIKKL